MSEKSGVSATASSRRLEIDSGMPGSARVPVLGGELEGKGELVIEIGDATQASLTFDHVARDRLVLGIHSAVGLRLSKTGTLKLEGGAKKELLQGELSGEVRARLTLARAVDVTVTQSFRASGPTTSLRVKVRL